MIEDRTGVTDAIENDELLRFADGELDDAGRVRVLTRLASRPAAVERVEAYLEQNARFRELRRHLPMADSRDFARPLQDALVAALTRATGRWRGRPWGLAAAVALALCTGIAGLALAPLSSERAGGQAKVTAPATPTFFPYGMASASQPLTSEGMLPVAAEDDVAAFDWLEGHVRDFSLSAPALDRIGLQLVGGETMTTAGMPVIRLGYRDAAGNPVVLYAGVTHTDAPLAFRPVQEGHLSMQWRRGPMIFALVAPADSPQLSSVVEVVGSAVARHSAPEPREGESSEAKAAAGPVQAIAVPLARPEPVPPRAGEATDPVVDPAKLVEPADDNEPKPL